MLFPRLGQERITAVHQFARRQRVGIFDWLVHRQFLVGYKPNGEEDFFVLLQNGVQLVHDFVPGPASGLLFALIVGLLQVVLLLAVRRLAALLTSTFIVHLVHVFIVVFALCGLFLFPALVFLLFRITNAVLDDVGPEVAFKVWQ